MSAVGSFRIIMGSIRKITGANRANYISIIMGWHRIIIGGKRIIFCHVSQVNPELFAPNHFLP